jgi:hypothetical protein
MPRYCSALSLDVKIALSAASLPTSYVALCVELQFYIADPRFAGKMLSPATVFVTILDTLNFCSRKKEGFPDQLLINKLICGFAICAFDH